MDNFKPTQYKLQNIATKNTFEDSGWMLDDPSYSAAATLIRSVYSKKQIDIKPCNWGIYRFADWLPISRMLTGSSAPLTFKSTALASYLKLNNLYITFNGYSPKHGANMSTCSFKETEAYSVCGRMTPNFKQILVVASAGNTARAFAKVCSQNNIPLLLSVPYDNLSALWFEEPLNPCVKLISPEAGADYFDAIHLGNIAVSSNRYIAEGGAKNIARRDGMGTTLLSAADAIGSIPDYYFQAVGSGTGAIAAHEAAVRLAEDGRYGKNQMKMILSQNDPFVPMYDAWRASSREILPFDNELARKQVEEIDAKVLSNRKPPYSVIGGMYDALIAQGGDILKIDNAKARDAAKLFEEIEGVDIHPAAAVATASLIEYAPQIDPNATVSLNITGGGEELFKKGKELYYLKPTKVFKVNPNETEVLDFLADLKFTN